MTTLIVAPEGGTRRSVPDAANERLVYDVLNGLAQTSAVVITRPYAVSDTGGTRKK